MFRLENWIFASDARGQPAVASSDDTDCGNETLQVRSPLRPLAQEDFFARLHIRDVLLKRQFACPEGTRSCSSIGAPDVCCGTTATCIHVDGNTDAGSVGCCPPGRTCAGSVSCDTSMGFSACPGSPNGGCCLPGFQCQGIGCVSESTSTVYVVPSTTSASSTAIVVDPTTPPSPPPTLQNPISSSAYVCSSGWFSCAASLGGGCCQNGRTCATGASCIGNEPTSTQAPLAPVRPTSGTASPPDNICPSGFYVCSAYYPSGCCRVGRDCQTTGSCVLPSKTIISTNGVVVVAPTGAQVAATTTVAHGRSCPSAWYSCAADRGGNCCPNGFECGEQCTATASGQSGVQGKVAPSAAAAATSLVSHGMVWVVLTAWIATGTAMLAL